MSFAERMLRIDRRIIFLVIGALHAVPLAISRRLAHQDFSGGAGRLRLHRRVA